MKRQYKPRIGLDKYINGILKPIKVKSHHTTSGLDFKHTGDDCTTKGATACKLISKVPLKIRHPSVTFPTPGYTYQPQTSEQTSMTERPEPTRVDPSFQNNVSSAIDIYEVF